MKFTANTIGNILGLTSLLLVGCGTQINNPANTTEQTFAAPQLLTSLEIPQALRDAEIVPAALGQLTSLRMMNDETLRAQANNAITTFDVYSPHGVLVERLEVFGPQKLNLAQLRNFGDEYSYSLVGANSIQDRVYVYGHGQYLSGRLNTTINAIGGAAQFSHFMTSNMLDLIVVTKQGELYLLGESQKISEDQAANLRNEYDVLVDAWQNQPESFKENEQIWLAIASDNGQPTQQSLNQLTESNYGRIIGKDGSIDLSIMLRASQELEASSLREQPAFLRTLNYGNRPDYDGTYHYNGPRNRDNQVMLPGGGFAQRSGSWGDFVTYTPGVPTNRFWSAYYFAAPGMALTDLIGCSAGSAQALIHDIHRQGRPVRVGNEWLWWQLREVERYNPVLGKDYLYHNYAIYTELSQVNYDAARHMPGEFPTYKILNETMSDGTNFSTNAMRAGIYYNDVSNTVQDIGPGLAIMLNKVWPEYYPTANINNVWMEWKTAGAGSNGTMRQILKDQLLRGNTVIATYPTGGTAGHTSVVSSSNHISYQSWGFWTGYDAYVSTIDHPYESRLVTGRNVPASGIYSVVY